MQLFYDRFNLDAEPIDVVKLPDNIELGRYFYTDQESGKLIELTNRTAEIPPTKRVWQDLLEERNESDMQLFLQFRDKVLSGSTSVVPLVQDVQRKIFLTEFEKKLKEEIWHLDEICRRPHFLLNRKIEKVHISRAKRPSVRSYGYLSSHTEEWLQKSIVHFTPRCVLNEELDEFYDVYENHIAVAFIDRTLRYLRTRINEIGKITDLMRQQDRLYESMQADSSWHRRVDRNLRIISMAFDADEEVDEMMAGFVDEIESDLRNLHSKLLEMRSSVLYSDTNHKLAESRYSDASVNRTNVTVNHKHYRYLPALWNSLNSARREKDESEFREYEQQVIEGVRAFAKSVIRCSVENLLGFSVSGDFNKWNASNERAESISFSSDKYGIFSLKINNGPCLKFIVIIGGYLGIDSRVERDTIILRYNDMGYEDNKIDSSNVEECHASKFYCENANSESADSGDIYCIDISPYDANSSEWLAKVIRGELLKCLVERVHRTYPLHRISSSLCHSIFDNVNFITLSENASKYFFSAYPGRLIESHYVQKCLSANKDIQKLKPHDKFQVINSVQIEVDEINNEIESLQNILKCPVCGRPYSEKSGNSIEYLLCCNKDCNCSCSINRNSVCVRNRDPKKFNFKDREWGMDYVYMKF